MKKLLPLLILSFFSAQSFSGACPDGSEPIKSVSADGTYYVFNCGIGNISNTNDVDNKSENSTLGQSIYKTITQGDPEIYEAQMLLTLHSVARNQHQQVSSHLQHDRLASRIEKIEPISMA